MGPAGVAQVILTNSALLGKGDYYIDFPPNNAGWLQGIDKIIASPKKGLYVVASVKITDVPRKWHIRGQPDVSQRDLLVRLASYCDGLPRGFRPTRGPDVGGLALRGLDVTRGVATKATPSVRSGSEPFGR